MARGTRRESNQQTVKAISSKLTPEQITDVSKRAMLVSLSLSVWDSNITDKAASAEVSVQKGITESGLCRVRKTRVPRNPYTKSINELVNNLRQYHYSATLLWTRDGTRVLPVANFQEYTLRVNLAKQQLQLHVQALIDNYDQLKVEAKKMLGSLYKEGDYLSPRELITRYSISTQFMPLPNTGQFLDLGFSSEQEQALRKQLETDMRTSLVGATERVWHDLYEKVKSVSEQLGNPDSRMQDRALTSLSDMAEMLPRLNLMNDPVMNAMAETLKSTLQGLTINRLKLDEGLRRDAYNQTSQAVARMETLMFPGIGASQLI